MLIRASEEGETAIMGLKLDECVSNVQQRSRLCDPVPTVGSKSTVTLCSNLPVH